MNNMSVALVILNFNDYQITQRLVNYVKDYKTINNIIVVDNYSENSSFTELSLYFEHNEKVDVIQTDTNGGYSYGNNYGIKYAIEKYSSSVIAVANPDIIFEEQAINYAALTVYSGSYAMVSPIMHDADDLEVLQPYWDELPNYAFDIMMNFSFFRHNTYKKKHLVDYQKDIMDVCMMPGSFYIFNAETLTEIGYFDPGVFLFSEEAIISKKILSHGYKIGLITKYSYLHLHSHTIKQCIKEIDTFKIQSKSRTFYQVNYNGVKGIRLAVLKVANFFGLVEYSIFIYLKRLIMYFQK